jgi:hypothetical protein
MEITTNVFIVVFREFIRLRADHSSYFLSLYLYLRFHKCSSWILAFSSFGNSFPWYGNKRNSADLLSS